MKSRSEINILQIMSAKCLSLNSTTIIAYWIHLNNNVTKIQDCAQEMEFLYISTHANDLITFLFTVYILSSLVLLSKNACTYKIYCFFKLSGERCQFHLFWIASFVHVSKKISKRTSGGICLILKIKNNKKLWIKMDA